MKRHMLAATTVVAFLFLLTVGAPHASADTFDLTSCHIGTGCPVDGTIFGTVKLTENSDGSVLFDVVLNSGSLFVETGFNFLFAFNDAVTGSEITGITATLDGNPVTIAGGLLGLTGGDFKADGFADHSAKVYCATSSSCNGASGADINDLHFTVSNETIANLTTGPAFFVTDILCGPTVTGCAGKTGLVDASTGGTVPDGGMTLMLLGGALFGLETLRRKIRA